MGQSGFWQDGKFKMLPILRACGMVFMLPVFAVASTADTAVSVKTVSFLPHRAVYDLTLHEASDRSGIDDMKGRIVYELTGSFCEGYAARYRYSTRIQMGGKTLLNDQRSTVFESADGNRFDFITQYFLNGQQEQDLRGSATRSDKGILVTLKKPDERKIELERAMFMNEHLVKIVETANAGETFLTTKVYDGSDDADEVMDTNTVIGKRKDHVGALTGEPKKLAEKFDALDAWRVSVSYFKTGKVVGGGERLPAYQVSFILHEDGVSRDLTMRYEDYSLKAAMKEIEYLKAEPCE